MTDDDDELLPEKLALPLLKMTRNTARKRVLEGTLKRVKDNGRNYYRLSEINRYDKAKGEEKPVLTPAVYDPTSELSQQAFAALADPTGETPLPRFNQKAERVEYTVYDAATDKVRVVDGDA